MRVRHIAGWAVLGLNALVATALVLIPSTASAAPARATICANVSCSGPSSCAYQQDWGCAIASGGASCSDGPCSP